MSFHVELDIKDEAILLIGGGKVALRKCKQCLAQGGKVSILSKQVDEEFKMLDVEILHKEYHADLLDQYFFCIVCSDDLAFHEQVIQDAKRKHRFIMGTHIEDDANMRPMVAKEYEYFQIALSTKGNFPAITTHLLEEAGKYLMQKETKRLQKLAFIRKELKQQMPLEKRQGFCRLLVAANMYVVTQVEEILKHEQCCMLCYHGVKQEEALQSVEAFEKEVQKKKEVYVFSTYLSKAVCDVVNQKGMKIFPFDDIMHYLSKLKNKHIEIVPMLFQKGHYFTQIKKWNSFSNIIIQSVPFFEESAVMCLCNMIQDAYPMVHKILVRYHSTKGGELTHVFQKIAPLFQKFVFLLEKEKMPCFDKMEEQILVVPLYMLSGYHQEKDCNLNEKSILELSQKGHQIHCIKGSMIENSILKQVLLKEL